MLKLPHCHCQFIVLNRFHCYSWIRQYFEFFFEYWTNWECTGVQRHSCYSRMLVLSVVSVYAVVGVPRWSLTMMWQELTKKHSWMWSKYAWTLSTTVQQRKPQNWDADAWLLSPISLCIAFLYSVLRGLCLSSPFRNTWLLLVIIVSWCLLCYILVHVQAKPCAELAVSMQWSGSQPLIMHSMVMRMFITFHITGSRRVSDRIILLRHESCSMIQCTGIQHALTNLIIQL